MEAARNVSTWFDTLDFKNDNGWNSTNYPPSLDIGYELKEAVSVPNTTLPYYIISNGDRSSAGRTRRAAWRAKQPSGMVRPWGI